MSAGEVIRRVEQNLRLLGFSEDEIAAIRAEAAAVAGATLGAGPILIDVCPACGERVDGLNQIPTHRRRDGRMVHFAQPCGHAVLVRFEAVAGSRTGRHVVFERP